MEQGRRTCNQRIFLIEIEPDPCILKLVTEREECLSLVR
jgi:hypothetical protein